MFYDTAKEICDVSHLEKRNPLQGTRTLVEKMFEQSHHQTLFIPIKERENIDKPREKQKENGHRNQIQVRESVTQGKGIRTHHIRCTQREPLS